MITINPISAIKDAATFFTNTGNAEMQQKMIDVQAQILEMQQQMFELRQKAESLENENKRLVDVADINEKVERHNTTFITLSDDNAKIPYCSACWDKDRILVQLPYRLGFTSKCSNSNCNNDFVDVPTREVVTPHRRY